jgi:DNA-binding GntR family transcriptional regulator
VKGLQTVSVVDALTASLREKVLDGQIDAGAGLGETDVAADYEVSRPTAKAAIAALVAEGLLRREAHRSAQVPTLSRADVEDLFLVRIPLELEVVRLLAGRPIPDAAASAVHDLAQMPPDARHSMFVEADLRFHRALFDAVASPRLTRLYQLLSGEIHLSMVQSRYELGRDRIVDEHDAVLAALRAGEVDRATELMRVHLEGARDALAAQLDRRRADAAG